MPNCFQFLVITLGYSLKPHIPLETIEGNIVFRLVFSASEGTNKSSLLYFCDVENDFRFTKQNLNQAHIRENKPPILMKIVGRSNVCQFYRFEEYP